MNSNQRSQGNNQSDNGGNVLDTSRGGTADKGNLNNPQDKSQQSGTLGGSQQRTDQRQGAQQEDRIGQNSTDRAGSQTGNQQQEYGVHDSNDAAGSYPMSPRGKQLTADEKMNDDTGLSNTANRQSAEPDEGYKQELQSNVGRRSDGTPD